MAPAEGYSLSPAPTTAGPRAPAIASRRFAMIGLK